MVQSHVIGIDVGGTNVVFGIVDARGSIIALSRIKTRMFGEDPDAFLDHLANSVMNLVEEMGLIGGIRGIGIGAPNGNYYTGKIDFAANLPWKKPLPIVQILSEKLKIPTILTNDAKAAAIGEMTYGAAKGMKDFMIITLGTGVGSGIVVNGRVVYGCDSLAGELGHCIIIPQGRSCGCGRAGCMETYCSASGMVRTALEYLVQRTEPSLLRRIPTEELTSKDIFEAAKKGDAMAIDVFNFTGKMLGQSLANFVNFSSPEAFILFGGVTAAGDLLMKPTQEAFQESLLRVYTPPRILFSQLPESDAAILGAAAIAWEAK